MEGNDIEFYEDNFTLLDVIRSTISKKKTNENFDDAFHLMNLGYQVEMVDQWKRLLPGITPFFAMKSNPDPVLLSLFVKMNLGFDCASKGEIEQVLHLGGDPSRIIYSNSRKQPSHIAYAAKSGVQVTVVDDTDELFKIKRIAPNMKLLLRISTLGFTKDNFVSMTEKYGCPKRNTTDVLKLAQQLQLNIIGVSFHIGLFAKSAETFGLAIQEAKSVFEEAEQLGFTMKMLDIGGGMPPRTTVGIETLQFEEVSNVIRESLRENFGMDHGVTVIAEPGSYFTMPSTVLVANIIGKRCEPAKENSSIPEIEYFINDGIFSSFALYTTFTEKEPLAKPVSPEYAEATFHRCRIWGQTLCGDTVLKSCELPNMNTSDWLYFPDCGAYCAACASTFNGFQRRPVYHYMAVTKRQRMEDLISDGCFHHNTLV